MTGGWLGIRTFAPRSGRSGQPRQRPDLLCRRRQRRHALGRHRRRRPRRTLLRLPGFRHHRHDPADSLSAAGDAVSSVRELRNGEFWVAYRSEGLDRFDRRSGRFEHFRARASDPDSLSSDAASVCRGFARRVVDRHARWRPGPSRPVAAARGTVRAIDSREGLAADAIGAIVETHAGCVLGQHDRRCQPASSVAGGDRHGSSTMAAGTARSRAVTGSMPESRLPDGRIVFGGLDGITRARTKAISWRQRRRHS